MEEEAGKKSYLYPFGTFLFYLIIWLVDGTFCFEAGCVPETLSTVSNTFPRVLTHSQPLTVCRGHVLGQLVSRTHHTGHMASTAPRQELFLSGVYWS